MCYNVQKAMSRAMGKKDNRLLADWVEFLRSDRANACDRGKP